MLRAVVLAKLERDFRGEAVSASDYPGEVGRAAVLP